MYKMGLLQVLHEKEIVKIITINTKEQIFKNAVIMLGSATHNNMDLNVLCLFLTSSLRDSDLGYPVFIQVNDYSFK